LSWRGVHKKGNKIRPLKDCSPTAVQGKSKKTRPERKVTRSNDNLIAGFWRVGVNQPEKESRNAGLPKGVSEWIVGKKKKPICLHGERVEGLRILSLWWIALI